jgi:hypothetical protein
VSCLCVCLLCSVFIQFSSDLHWILHGCSHVSCVCFYITTAKISWYVRLCGGKFELNWLATTGDNLYSTHEIITSLKYAHGILNQNSIDCPASGVKSSSWSKLDAGTWWLSGRASASWPKGRGFESHQVPLCWVLEQDSLPLIALSTQLSKTLYP